MIAIADVTMIDATGAPPRPHTTVVIEGNRIAAIRPTETAQDLEGMRGLTGRFVGLPRPQFMVRSAPLATMPHIAGVIGLVLASSHAHSHPWHASRKEPRTGPPVP